MAAAAHAGPAAPRAASRGLPRGPPPRGGPGVTASFGPPPAQQLGSEVGLAGQMAATPQPELPQRPPRCGCASISFRDVRWHEACLRQALCCAACCISHAAVRPSIQHAAAPSTAQPAAASHPPACSWHAILRTSSDASLWCTGVAAYDVIAPQHACRRAQSKSARAACAARVQQSVHSAHAVWLKGCSHCQPRFHCI